MDKGKRGGKYGRIRDANGYYGRHDAGDDMYFTPKSAGDNVGFKGSKLEIYTFSDNVHGTHTFTASSYEDALRQAKVFGFDAEDYVGQYKGRKKRGKK